MTYRMLRDDQLEGQWPFRRGMNSYGDHLEGFNIATVSKVKDPAALRTLVISRKCPVGDWHCKE